jgi:tRNA A37 threonylcarbamoyladenosine modification protein TsaB
MQIGFYRDGKLIETKEYQGLTSDILLPILEDILNRYSVKSIIYTNGPGSHMSTKIAFVLLKTLNIIREIPLFSTSAFELNGNKPIKALGKLYFIKEKETIITKRFDTSIKEEFFMPKELKDISISKNIEPNYFISAV